jgi:hypothetical protein
MQTSHYRKPATAHHVRAPRRAIQAAGAAVVASALAVSIPALAAAATAGVTKAYTGKSKQGLPVKLSKPTSGGRRFTYQATMNCSDGTTFTDDPFVDLVTIKNGKFSSRYKSDRGATQTNVRGTIKGKQASGTVKITERYGTTPTSAGNFPLDPKGAVVCQSGAVKWTAKAH